MEDMKVFMYFLDCFYCAVLRISPGQVENYQLFISFAGLRSQYSKRYKHAGTSYILF